MVTERVGSLASAVRKLTRKVVGAVIAWVMIAAGLRLRSLRALDRHRRVICVVAHNPSRSLTRRVIEWFLARGFEFVSQGDVLDAIRKRRELPRRAIWLVLDDGWKGNLTEVLPLLRQHGIPATLAISPGETRLEIAWPTLADEHGGPASSFARLVDLPDAERKAACARLLESSGRTARRPLLSVEDVKALAADRLITVENHGYGHACSTRCTPDEFRDEVIAANRLIEAWTGRRPTMFFYPFGAWSPELDELLPECGIDASANSGNRFLDLDNHVGTMAIPRIALLDDITLAEGTCRLLRAWIR
jgi:peptidoglycan/xylan/chitin deacetylase (PgdA/CDA1 family)